jgi:hypothetical protein
MYLDRFEKHEKKKKKKKEEEEEREKLKYCLNLKKEL